MPNQLHTGAGIGCAFVVAPVIGLAAEDAAADSRIAPTTTPTTIAAAHGKVSTAAITHPHTAVVGAPAAPFDAGAIGNLAYQLRASASG